MMRGSIIYLFSYLRIIYSDLIADDNHIEQVGGIDIAAAYSYSYSAYNTIKYMNMYNTKGNLNFIASDSDI